MDQQQTSYEAIVRAQIAIAIMNKARGMVSERVAALEAVDPAGAEALRGKRRDLLAIHNGIRVGETDRIEALICVWGPRITDTALFWREF